MDSLVANYASSDDDEEAGSSRPPLLLPKLPSLSTALPPPKSSSAFSSLPPPRTSTTSPSSTLFSSLPPPKFQLPSFSSNDDKKVDDEGRHSLKPLSFPILSSLPPPKTFSSPSSSIFSSLPPPKSQSLDQNPKRVVQFTLPLNPSMLKSQNLDDDDDEEDKERKFRKDASPSSASKSLSSILPAPKNSLGMAPAHSLGGSRRSIMQADAPSVNLQRGASAEEEMSSFAEDAVYGEEQGAAAVYDTHGSYSAEQEVSGHENCTNYDVSWSGGSVDTVAAVSVDSTYASNPGWEQAYVNGVGYGNYMNNWPDVSGEVITSDVLDIARIAGKRGRADMPKEILEVKQDELMKNRPREDQVKLTGIAFGPAYQTVPSAKGKPTKLHKRKHQIGSLYYDMRQKEMELAERRSKGLLTKSETQAKYGW